MIVVVLAAACGHMTKDQVEAPQLRLVESGSVRLPARFEPAGAALAADGVHAVVWSFSQTSVLLVSSSGWTEVELPIQAIPLAVAFGPGDSTLELIHGNPANAATVTLEGRLINEQPLSRAIAESINVVAATRLAGGWAWGGLTRQGEFVVFQDTARGAAPIAEFEHRMRAPLLPDSLSDLMFHLSPDRLGGVLVTSMWPPYEEWRFDTAGTQTGGSRGAPDRASPPGNPRESLQLPLFVSLPTLALDTGYLQVLADVRSDRRELRILDDRFGLVRFLQLTAPLGFLASDPTRRQLVAARRTNGVSLIFYEWGWANHTTP